MLSLLLLPPLQGQPLSGLARNYPLPHAIAEATPSRTLADDWTGDLRPDVVLLADGAVCLQHGPDTFPTGEVIPASVAGAAVIDLETLPLPNGPHALLALGAGGVRVLTWDTATQAFVHASTLASGGWAGALSIHLADLGGSALPDYVGTSPAGNRILLMRDFDGVTATHLPQIVIGAPLLELDPIDWTGDAPDEIAVRLAGGVLVCSSTGGPALYVSSTTGTPRLIQPVRCAFETDERLAYVESAPGTGDDWLGVVGSAAPFSNMHLGAFGIVGAAARDIDKDEDDDLVLSHVASTDLLVLVDRSGPTPFSPADVFVVPSGSSAPAPGNRAEPCLADLDGDTDVDLAVANPVEDRLLVVRNVTVDEIAYWPLWSGERFDTMLWQVDPGLLNLDFHVQSPLASTFGYDALQVVVWRQATLSALADPVPTHSFVAPFFSDPDAAPFQVLLNESLAAPDGFEAVYNILLRVVATDAQGNVVQAGPTGTFFYTPGEDSYADLYAQLPEPYQPIGSTPPDYEIDQQAFTGGGGGNPGPPPPAK